MEFSRKKWENIEINDEILAINSVEKEFYKYCCYFVQFFEARQIKRIQFHETSFWNETNYKRFKRRFNQWWLDFRREIKICFVWWNQFIHSKFMFISRKKAKRLLIFNSTERVLNVNCEFRSGVQYKNLLNTTARAWYDVYISIDTFQW